MLLVFVIVVISFLYTCNQRQLSLKISNTSSETKTEQALLIIPLQSKLEEETCVVHWKRYIFDCIPIVLCVIVVFFPASYMLICI